MSTEPSYVIPDELIKDVAQAALSLHESADMLTRLSRRVRPNTVDANFLIKHAYFKIKWLAERFKIEL